jgi:hypothetical protein
MGATKAWLEDKAQELGSVELAYDAYAGVGAYAYLKWNAEDEDEESIEMITMLHDWLGAICNDTDPKLNFIHRVTAEEWQATRIAYAKAYEAKTTEIQRRLNKV